MARPEEAYLEYDELPPGTDAPRPPPSAASSVQPVGEETWLELPDAPSDAPARAPKPSRAAITEEHLRVVAALAEDNRPLIAALWPAEPDVAARMPDHGVLAERIALARAAINQATRRSAEWRARAELAGATLSRRLGDKGVEPATAADELLAWHREALMALARAEADATGRLYAAETRRLDAEARQRGISPETLHGWCEALKFERVTGDAGWPPCDALPGAPRTRDAVAEALVRSQAQGVAALADGSIAGWLAAARAPPDLVEAADEARALAMEKSTAAQGLWLMVWALGREGVQVEGLEVGAPEALLAHMRSARLHDSTVAAVAPVLARWFRRRGNLPVAVACDALAKGEAHALEGLRWSLGEPLRVGGRSVHDPAGLAREVVSREPARVAAVAAWRDGTLAHWLSTLPIARRDALWSTELAQATEAGTQGTVHHEGVFWRGVYRRAPRAALKVHVAAGVARFASASDILVTARVAAVWEPLKALLKTGELLSWLEVSAPGIDFAELAADSLHTSDLALNTVLWAVGHTGMVLPWDSGGVPVSTPSDVVAAYTRSPSVLEPAGTQACVSAWLKRFHGDARAGGVSVGRALAAMLHPEVPLPDHHGGLLLALLCGLDALPADPMQPGGGRPRRAWVGIRRTPPEGTDREAGWEPLRAYLDSGVALVWAARHAPELGAVLAARIDGVHLPGEAVAQLAVAGVPRASAALAGELDTTRENRVRESARQRAAREAAEREAARTMARIEAEREAARLASARVVLRAEAEREIADLNARRDEARLATDREIARLATMREASRLETLKARADRDEAEKLEEAQATAEAEGRRLEEAQLTATDDAARRSSARDDASREAAKRTADERAALEARWAAERAVAEAELARVKQEAEGEEDEGGVLAEARDGAEPEAEALVPMSPEAVFGQAALQATEADDADGEFKGWGDRREIVAERLIDAPVDDDTRALVMAAVNAWAHALPNHPWQDLATRMEVLEITSHPAFELGITTRLETRASTLARPPWRDDRTVPAPPDLMPAERDARHVDPVVTVDPWSVGLPEADTYGPWSAEYLLDLPPVRRVCPACDGAGKSVCVKCTGEGTVPCRRCDASGRSRCPTCVGAGAVLGDQGPARCTQCDSRGSVVCEACTAGRARCRACGRAGKVSCTVCSGRGALAERMAVSQSFASVAALAVVAEGVAPAVAAAVRSTAAEGRTVVHVEGAELDPYVLAREIPHVGVGAQAAQLLAEEAARGGEGTRATRQRLIVRRYPVWKLRYRTGDREDELWVHGVRRKVHADDSPIARHIQGLVAAAREALAQGDTAVVTDRLLELVQIDAEHAEGRAVAGALGEAVLAMALRGELFAAREAAARAARLRWPECVAPLVEAERVLARRLNAPTAWALLEEASRALEKGRLSRVAERLCALSVAEPDHTEGKALAQALTERVSALWVREPDAALALASVMATVPWGGCRALAEVITRKAADVHRRRAIVRWTPVTLGLMATLGFVVYLLVR